jgi:hypothetical protein
VASLKQDYQDYQQRIAAAAPANKERILNEAVNAAACRRDAPLVLIRAFASSC